MGRPFTLEEARAAGLTLDALAGQAWRRLGSELYCWAKLPPDPWRLLVAWRGRLPSEAVFIGLTAAWLHRFQVDAGQPIEVAVRPESGTRSRPGLHVRRRRLHPNDVVDVRGLRATTPGRTLRDLRRRLPRVEYLVLADSAMRLGFGRYDDLAESAESPMETRLRWLLLEAGLPRAEVQADLFDSHGKFIGRADLLYRSARLVIEYDGGNHRDRLVEDDRRQSLLVRAGFRVLRYTAADVFQRGGAIASEVKRLF